MTTKITEQNISNLANIGVQWQSVFTGDGSTGLTAVAGRGYFIDTTSGTVEVTLPASPSAGDVVVLKDYARTWGTNAVSLASTLMDGSTSTTEFSTQGQTVTLVYMDGTKGWSLVNEDSTSKLEVPASFIAATGGTVTESGDYKIHTFTGDGCFVVSSVGNAPVTPIGGPNAVDYLVVAGGASGASSDVGAGGGAGGYRESSGAASGCYSASPLGACVSGITVTATTYPITVGAGGASQPNNSFVRGNAGSNSVFSTITSTGGGGGGGGPPAPNANIGGPGGSGGGGSHSGEAAGGSGNTPPVSPPQGNNGGSASGGSPAYGSGGGGGAGAVGGNGTASNGGNGGAGVTSSITGSPVTRAGGGAGARDCAGGPFATGGSGGGGNTQGAAGPAGSGSANTGSGGGGASGPGGNPLGGGGDSGGGGKGIVVIRYKFQ